MTKATRILNEHHIKELILKGDPQYENFYKEELIEFCKISKHEIDRLNNIINGLEDWLGKQRIRNSEWDNFVIKDTRLGIPITYLLDKLKELKDSD